MNRVSVSVIIALVVAAPCVARAQTSGDEAAVRRAATDYIEGFYTGDSTLLVRSVHPSVYKYGFWLPKGKTAYEGEQMPYPEFMKYAARVKSRGNGAPPNAPKEVKIYEVLDQTASAKITAWWGIDYLLFGKFDGKWMITHVLWQSPPPK